MFISFDSIFYYFNQLSFKSCPLFEGYLRNWAEKLFSLKDSRGNMQLMCEQVLD
jgi:hypothetical protein